MSCSMTFRSAERISRPISITRSAYVAAGACEMCAYVYIVIAYNVVNTNTIIYIYIYIYIHTYIYIYTHICIHTYIDVDHTVGLSGDAPQSTAHSP